MFCVTRRVLGFTYVYFWVGPNYAESEPSQQRGCSDKGVSTCGIIGRCQQKCFEFFYSEAFSNDEGWNKLRDPASDTTRQQKSWCYRRRLFLRQKRPLA